MNYRIGVDIGGTTAKLGVVSDSFEIIVSNRVPTRGRRSEEIVSDIIEVCKSYCSDHRIESIGIGCAGSIDNERGYVRRAGNLPFSDEPVAPRISQATGLPAFIDNDANCALIGEHAAGAAKGYADAIILTVGTGIGGAVMIRNKIYRGRDNRAGELGHFVVDMNGRECECGLNGCFEQYASASALISMTEKSAQLRPDSVLARFAKDGIDGKTAFDAMRAGCPVADALVGEYGRILSIGINSLTHIFRPQVIILSGGVAREKEALIDVITPWLLPETNLLTTQLFGNGGLVGASLLGTPFER